VKVLPILISVSVVANATLLGFLAYGVNRDADSAPAAETAAPGAQPATAPAAESTADWTELRSDDLAAETKRLRAEGFPPSLVRAIIAAQVRERFATRRKPIEAALADRPYWLQSEPDPKLQAEMRALAKEERAALKELLGNDAESGPGGTLRRQFPNLAPEKIDQLAEIQERYNEKRNEVYESMRGAASLPSDQDKITALEKAARAEVAAVLSPQELEDYDLRTSRTAMNLRNSLSTFDPNEQEFRALYALQSAFNDQWGQMREGMTQEQMRARSQADQELRSQIKLALGDARYADYQRSTDFNFRRTSQLVERLGLPPQTATDLYTLQRETQQRASEIRRDPSLAPTDRVARVAALGTETQAKITAKLGAEGAEAYKNYGGTWVQNLTPRPPPPK
jgi:hypothetical protein